MTRRRASGLLIGALLALMLVFTLAPTPGLYAEDLLHRVFMPIAAERVDSGSGNASDNDGTYVSHYDPVFIVDISGRVHVDGALPLDRTVIYAGGTGDMSRYVANWSVGDKTGFFPERAYRSTQRGIPNGTYGTSAVQMEAFTAGMHLQARAGDADAAFQFAQLYYDFGAPARPWATGINPRLCMDYDISVTASTAPAEGINYAYALMHIEEPFSEQSLWLLVTFYDSRADVIDRGDSMAWWTEANAPILYAYFGNDDFTTLMPESAVSTSDTWVDWRYFGFCMDTDQLVRAIRTANTTYGLAMPEAVDAYTLSAFGVGPEIYNPTLGQADISTRIRDVRLFTLADPEQEP